jgi:hypothetical protein
MLWARNHRSNGVSKLVRIGFILGRHGRSRRVAAGGEMMQREIVRSIVLRFGKGHEVGGVPFEMRFGRQPP